MNAGDEVEWEEGKKREFNRTLERFKKRRLRLQELCRNYQDGFRGESRGIYRPMTNDTSSRFYVGTNTFEICNIHHGGMSSWKAFINVQSFDKPGSNPERM